jgi:hypothetical protein
MTTAQLMSEHPPRPITSPGYRVVMATCYVRRPTRTGELHWLKLPERVEICTLYPDDERWAEHLMQAMVEVAREELMHEPPEVSHYRVRVAVHIRDAYDNHQLHMERTQIRRRKDAVIPRNPRNQAE